MTNADGDHRTPPLADGCDARTLIALRAASGPAPDDDAAARIAAGAWRRARSPGARSDWRRVLRGRALRAAAAVLVVAVGSLGVFALDPPAAAFAVEGAPIQMWKGDRWVAARRVHADDTALYAAEGVRTLRGPDGATIVPQPGTTLRIAKGETRGTFRVEILAGTAQVTGPTLFVSMADVDVAPDGGDGAFRALFVRGGAAATGAAPPAFPASAPAAFARVQVDGGSARVRRRSTGEFLDLTAAQSAALLPVGEGPGVRLQLGRLGTFSTDVALCIASGSPVVDVGRTGGDVIAVLGDGGGAVHGFVIDRAEVRFALDEINTAMLARVARASIDMQVDVDVAGSVSDDDVTCEIRRTLGDTSLRVLVLRSSDVVVESDGGVRRYPSVEAALAAEPERLGALRDDLAPR